jgi:hypothetical protein
LTVPRFVWLVFIGLICFAGVYRWQNVSEEPLIETDGQGYYAYLPAVFIYHDLQFLFVDSVAGKYYPEDKLANYVIETQRGNVNKYFVGTAIVETPFFIGTLVLSKLVGAPADGYSWPFQLMVGLAAVFSLCVGLFFLGRLLEELSFNRFTSIITLLALVFGTNLFYYTVYEPSMSHVYTFMVISIFLYSMRKVVVEMQMKHVVVAAVAFGLIVLIRPTNALILLAIPVVSGGWFGLTNFIERVISQPKGLLVGLTIVFAMIAIQPLFYFLQTGSPIVWSYEGEGFNFLKPELANVLLSYRKGLFVYCPVLVLAVLGIIAGNRRNTIRFGPLLLVLSGFTWVIASWWMWYYGGSYGHRAFIDLYPLFAIGLASAIQHGTILMRPWLVSGLALVAIPFQMVQTYQYVRHIIPFDNMTKTKFWNLFLRTGDDLAFYYQGYEGQESYSAVDSTVFINGFEQDLGWGNAQQISEADALEGSRSSLMGASDTYGPTLRMEAGSLPISSDIVRVSGWIRSDSWTTDLSFVCAVEDTLGNSYFWSKRPLRPQFSGKNEWSWCTALFRCGKPKDSTDRFVVYPMKSDTANVFFDNLEVSFIRGR